MQRKLSAETTTEDHLRMFNQNSLNNGIFNLYPYMTDATFSLFFSLHLMFLVLYAIKIPIKSLLEAFFDNEFIYRPKIGFHNPFNSYLDCEELIEIAQNSEIFFADNSLFSKDAVHQCVSSRLRAGVSNSQTLRGTTNDYLLHCLMSLYICSNS